MSIVQYDEESNQQTVQLVQRAGTPAAVRRLTELDETVAVMDVFWTLAQRVARTPLARKDQGKPEAVFAKMMKGHEIGLKPMESLDAIDVIDGNPTLKPLPMRAVILARGHDFDIVELTNQRCEIRARRREWEPDRWQSFTYDMDDAKMANLHNKDNWKKQPRDMLFARCTSRCGRAMFADVLHGMGYTPDEMRDAIEAEATVTYAKRDDRSESPALPAAADPGGQPTLAGLQAAYNNLSEEHRGLLKSWWKRNLPTGKTWPGETMVQLPPERIGTAIAAIESIEMTGEEPDDLDPDPDDDEPAAAPVPRQAAASATRSEPPPEPPANTDWNDIDGNVEAEILTPEVRCADCTDAGQCERHAPFDDPDITDAEIVEEETEGQAVKASPVPVGGSLPPQGSTPGPVSPPASRPGPLSAKEGANPTASNPRGGEPPQERLKRVFRESGITGPDRIRKANEFFERLRPPIKRLSELTVEQVLDLIDYLTDPAINGANKATAKAMNALQDTFGELVDEADEHWMTAS